MECAVHIEAASHGEDSVSSHGTRLSQKMQEHPMSRTRQYHKQQAKAIQRRRHTATERLQRDRRQAQQTAEALQQALNDLGLPEDLVTEIEGRLRSQQKLLGKIVGGDVSTAVRVPYQHRAVPGARLG